MPDRGRECTAGSGPSQESGAQKAVRWLEGRSGRPLRNSVPAPIRTLSRSAASTAFMTGFYIIIDAGGARGRGSHARKPSIGSRTALSAWIHVQRPVRIARTAWHSAAGAAPAQEGGLPAAPCRRGHETGLPRSGWRASGTPDPIRSHQGPDAGSLALWRLCREGQQRHRFGDSPRVPRTGDRVPHAGREHPFPERLPAQDSRGPYVQKERHDPGAPLRSLDRGIVLRFRRRILAGSG